MTRDLSRQSFIIAFGVALCSCSDDGSGTKDAANSGGAAGDSEEAPVSCSSSYVDLKVGPDTGLTAMDATSGITARILDASENPPVPGYNTWKVGLTDASGAPATNARITWACAYMTVHSHGSNPKMSVNLGNGEYKLVDQYLRMSGPWEMRLWIDPTGTEPEYAPEKTPVNIVNGAQCEPTVGRMGAPSVEFKVCVPR